MAAAGLANIQNIIVVMLENRSFDNLLGFLYDDQTNRPRVSIPASNIPTCNGLTAGGYWNPSNAAYFDSPPAKPQKVFATEPALSLTVPDPDPEEDFDDMTFQIFGTREPANGQPPEMRGFLVDYQKVAANSADQIMQCYSSTQTTVLSQLALNYAICDEWFASAPCQTWPNRAFMHLGTANGRVNNPPYDPCDYDLPTIFNVLQTQNVTWGVYNDSLFPSLTRLQLPRLWPSSLDSQFHGFDVFLSAAKNGTLPRYSFVEPSFLVEPNDEHPPHDVLLGEQFLWKIWQAVSTGKNWQSTLLIVTFDEHGGCPDHAAPPWNAVSPDNASDPGDEGFRFDRFGVRVPTVLVSPWIEAGLVLHRPQGWAQPYDQTSILRTLQEWLSIPADAMLPSARIAAAPSLDQVLSLDTPRTDLPSIAYPSGFGARVAASMPPNDLQVSIAIAAARRMAHPDPLSLVAELPTRQHVVDFLAEHQVVRNLPWHS